MSLTHLDNGQHASLVRLAEGPLPLAELPRDHVVRFVDSGLAMCDSLRVRITAKGHCELLRERAQPGRVDRPSATSAGWLNRVTGLLPHRRVPHRS